MSESVISYTKRCSQCAGKGYVQHYLCSRCDGNGQYIVVDERQTVRNALTDYFKHLNAYAKALGKLGQK